MANTPSKAVVGGGVGVQYPFLSLPTSPPEDDFPRIDTPTAIGRCCDLKV